jgi:ABC-type multidrug transport system ATPase subunit
VLELVNLGQRAKDRVHKYSQGMRQRLGLARSLLWQPKLLLLDEPTNGLDPEGVAELRAVIQNFGQQGIAVLVSSHILAEVERIARRVLIIDQGKLLSDGPLSQLLSGMRGSTIEYRLESAMPDRAQAMLAELHWVSNIRLVDGALQFQVATTNAEQLAPALVERGVRFTELLQVGHDHLEDAYLEVIRAKKLQKGVSHA